MTIKKGQQSNAHMMLNIIWSIISIVLLFLILYFTLQKERLQTREILFYAADEISDKVDNFIEDVLEPIYSLPIHSNNMKHCTPELLAALQRIAFNHPQISGLVLKNNSNQVICSTMEQSNQPSIPDSKQVTLYGPIKFTASDKPALIIQQRLGNYLVNIFLLKTVLEQTLHATSPLAQHAVLYDSNQHKFILQTERDKKNGNWKATEEKNYMSNDVLINSDNPHLLKMNLNNLDNFQIILLGDSGKIRKTTLFHIALTTALIIALSCLIYFYVRYRINKHFSLHGAILSAIKNNNFFPVYQPIFSNTFGAYVGAEVLLRWRGDEQEIIMPDSFIKEAEQSGLIIPITIQLVEKVFNDCHKLMQAKHAFHLALNLCAVHFEDDTFFDSLRHLCQKFNLHPQQFTLEITERSLFSDDDSTIIQRMEKLRQEGFSLAIDDFGTGHASINYLQHFPFNYLKIDKQFVQAIGTGAVTEALNLSIIQIAKNLKLTIIAEGVETLTQLEYLQAHGVELIQGWYFAKAMPIELLMRFIEGTPDE